MNKSKSLLCLICSFALGLVGLVSTSNVNKAVVVKAADENLIVNGSFETGEGAVAEGWEFIHPAFPEALDGNHDGARRVTMIYSADGVQPGWFPSLMQRVAVEANTDYTLSMYVLNWGTAAKQPLYVGYRNPNGADPYANIKDVCLTDIGTAWQKIEFTFNTGDLTDITVAAFAVTTAFDGTNVGGYLIDSVSLVKKTVENGGGLLTNGNFENGIVNQDYGVTPNTSWSTISWAAALNEPANAYEGNWLSQLAYANPALSQGEFPSLWQDVKLEKNTDYELSFYVKNWGVATYPTQGLHVGIRDMASATIWDNIDGGIVITDANGSYKKYTYTFNTKGLEDVRVAFFTPSISGGGFGGFHIDKVNLEKVDKNLLANSSFENGGAPMGVYEETATNWTTMSYAGVLNEPANARTGNHMANIPYAFDGFVVNAFPSVWEDVAVEKNTNYKVSFYAKAWGGAVRGNLWAGHRNHLGATPWDNLSGLMLNQEVTGEYTKFTYYFNSGDTELARIAFFTCTLDAAVVGAGGYQIDDVTVEKVPNMTVVSSGATSVYDGQAHGINVGVNFPVGVDTKVYYATEELTAANYLEKGSLTPITLTNAGEVKVYYYVVSAGYNDKAGSETIKITKADNAWTTKLACASIKKGQAVAPVAQAANGEVVFTYSTSENGEFTSEVPTAVGKYYVKATVAASENYNELTAVAQFDILALDMNVTAEGYAGTYDGQAHGITVNAADLTEAKVYYATEELTAENYLEKGSLTPITLTNAGEVKVYYYVVCEDYNAVSGNKTVSIAKADNAWTTQLSCPSVEEGNTLTPVAQAANGEVVFTYSTSENGEFTSEVPTAAGTYYVKATVAASENYNELSSVVSFEITAKQNTDTPSDEPSEEPSEEPTEEPSNEPTEEPSVQPSEDPVEPQEPTKKGCRGTTAGLIGLITLVGAIILKKKNK